MSYRYWFLAALTASLYPTGSLTRWSKISLVFTAWLLTGGWYTLHLLRHTYKRDFRLLFRGIKLLIKIALVKKSDKTVVSVFRELVKKYPNKVVYINAHNDEKWTYKDVEKYSNRVANFFLKEGYKKGDTIAFLMTNRPEYIATWMGLAKIGVIPAFINTNLRTTSLYHTITVASSKAMIYGIELEDGVKDVYKDLLEANGNVFPIYYSKRGSDYPENYASKLEGAKDLDSSIESVSANPEPLQITKTIHSVNPLLYIYTSGTTGLPKAVIITHIRQLFVTYAGYFTIGLTENDIIYCYLPLYHASGGQIGTAASLVAGSTTVLKKKFSASNFWTDCIKYDVTATQYIGEICRYLLACKSTSEETSHKIRIMFGNGLRPQIWERFVTRFNIPNIAEFYGATEGNSNMVNIENKIGCVGFIGVLFPRFIQEKLLPLRIIKVDPESGEPLRNEDGFCIDTKPNEPGEFIGKIVRGDPVKDFTGYRDKEATNKKILRDVFQKGDMYFRSGDILIMDEFGWLKFKDRRGDTFRWKGENVSTLEVEATISNILGLKDATSYGVEIPNTEGRAGMVAIPATNPDEVDLKLLFEEAQKRLPAYAIPFFIRFVKELEVTGTYKLKKNFLQEEGFDIKKVSDPIFFLHPKEKKYVALDEDIHDQIISGNLKL